MEGSTNFIGRINAEEDVIHESEDGQKTNGGIYHTRKQPVRTTIIRPMPFNRQFLTSMWSSFQPEEEASFWDQYGHIAELLYVPVPTRLLTHVVNYWDTSYHCFTFNDADMSPLAEEYQELLQFKARSLRKVYIYDERVKVTKVLTEKLLLKREAAEDMLVTIAGVTCVKVDLLLKHLQKCEPGLARVRALALLLYGVILYPRFEGMIDEEAVRVFHKDHFQVNPVFGILAETFRALDVCRQEGQNTLLGCSSLLVVWMISHFKPIPGTGILPPRSNKPISEEVKNHIWDFVLMSHPYIRSSSEQWQQYISLLNSQTVAWMATWMIKSAMLYQCGSHPWIPLMGPRGCSTQAPYMFRRQVGCVQFIPNVSGMNTGNFSYNDPDAKTKRGEAIKAWENPQNLNSASFHRTVNPREQVTQGYRAWLANRESEPRRPPPCCSKKRKQEQIEDHYQEKYEELLVKFQELKKRKQERNQLLSNEREAHAETSKKLEASEKEKSQLLITTQELRGSAQQKDDKIKKLRNMLTRLLKEKST